VRASKGTHWGTHDAGIVEGVEEESMSIIGNPYRPYRRDKDVKVCESCGHQHLPENAQERKQIGGVVTICGMPCWDYGKSAFVPCYCEEKP